MTELTRPIRRLLGRGDRSEPTPDDGVAVGRSRPTSRRCRPPPRSPSTSPRATRSSPTCSRRPARSTSRGWTWTRRPSPRCARPASPLVVPLVSQGELIGTLNLGPRLSEQEYSTDDRRLLTTLAAQAAPAIRVAQLVREQANEAAEKERLAQELRVATLIQQQFLPRQLPQLPQWQVAAYYGPARAVGGDFYDFVEMPDGRIGIAVGDVTDKGVPGGAGHGPDPQHPPRRGVPQQLARGDPVAGQRPARAGDAGEDVRDLPVRGPGPGDRATSSSPTPATTSRSSAAATR